MDRRLAIALIVLIVLAAVYYLAIRPSGEERDRPFTSPVSGRGEEGEFAFFEGNVDRIGVQRWKPEQRYTFSLVGEEWRVFDGDGSEGPGYRLSAEDFEDLFSKLENLEIKPKEVSRNPDNQYRFGVDDPTLVKEESVEGEGEPKGEEEEFDIQELMSRKRRMKPEDQSGRGVMMTFWEGEKEIGIVMIGESVPVDMRSQDRGMRTNFIRKADSPIVYELRENFFHMLRKDVKGWRDSLLLHFDDPGDIEFLEVKNPEVHLTFRESDGSWRIDDLRGNNAIEGNGVDSTKVSSYLRRFNTWRTSDFAQEEDLAEVSFDEKIEDCEYLVKVVLSDGDTLEALGVAGPPVTRGAGSRKDKQKAEPEDFYFVNPKYPDTVYKLKKWSLRSMFEKKLDDFKAEKPLDEEEATGIE